MSEAKELGDALERAVRAIEETIIRSDPGLSGAPFKIVPNAVITQNGERYEIDVHVTVNDGSSYQTVHFFECKNRKEPASQADVTLLADKVRILGASRGILVSKAFTSCARAKAQSTGIELYPFSDDVWFPLTAVESVRFGYHFPKCNTRIIQCGPGDRPAPAEWKDAICKFRSRESTFTAFAHYLAAYKLNKMGVFSRHSGNHSGNAKCAFDFEEGELIIGDWDVATIELDFDYSVSLYPACLVSTFSVEKKGRHARWEYGQDEVDGTRLALEITQLFKEALRPRAVDNG